jgi:F0F1-type ATP synthase membrane subunit b/b'
MSFSTLIPDLLSHPVLASGGGGGGGLLDTLGIYWQLVAAKLVAFLIFLFLIKTFLFDPVRKHMAERDAELAGIQDAAGVSEAARDTAVAELNTAEKDLQKRAYEAAQTLIRDGQAQKSETVGAAQSAALSRVAEARGAAQKGVDSALAEGHDTVVELCLDMLEVCGMGTLDPTKLRGIVEKQLDLRVAGKGA